MAVDLWFAGRELQTSWTLYNKGHDENGEKRELLYIQ